MNTIRAEQLVAHRGYQKHYPENTLLAIRKALELGALHVELDVQLSRDRVPMIYHDETLERMSAVPGRLSEKTALELQRLTAHEPQRFGSRFLGEPLSPLAALVPLIQAYPAATFYVELKEEAVRDHGAATCLQQIRQVLAPVLGQCVLISFDETALALAGERGFKRIGLVTRNWLQREQQIRDLRASILFVNKTRIPEGERIIAACPVVVYEVGEEKEARQWLQRGADKVETFAWGEILDDRATANPNRQ